MEIKPHKLLIDFDENGNFSDGILMYQLKKDTGEVLPKYQTISVKTKISFPIMAGILKDAINFAEIQEGKNV